MTRREYRLVGKTMLVCATVFGLLWLVLARAHAATLTARERSACYPDAVKFCAVKPGDKATLIEMFRVGFCLLGHRAELSPSCSAVFAEHGR